jgi:leucyl-tRNA synthetase
VHSWLGRVFTVVQEAVAAEDAPEPASLVKLTHRTVKGVTEDLERFRFNTAISKLQVLTNEMRKALDAGAGARGAARALTVMLAPFAPYAAEELWRVELGEPASVHLGRWPTYDPAQVVEDTVTLVVQVDGKVRDTIEVPADSGEDAVLALARASTGVVRALDGREVRKEIVRAPKLVNFVTRG